jgi:hypothetical protein
MLLQAQNASSDIRPCHLDTRNCYIQENMEEGIIKNLKRNAYKEIYKKHVKNFLDDNGEAE